MHKEILNNNQISLLPLLKDFKREFYLVGGTAIALHLGHRRSIDFDMFKATPFRTLKIIEKIKKHNFSYKITRNVSEQLNLMISDVKLTFFEYPFPIKIDENFENIFRLPSLLELAAMKAYALGRRAKWKDYVDLYFIIKHHFTIKQIADRADEIYGDLFSEKLFRAQLAYYKNVDYSEEVEFLHSPVNKEEIKDFLTDKALEI